MVEQIKKVQEFQEKFRRTVNTAPTLLNEAEYNLRHNLMAEENNEYFKACVDKDKIEILDALADKLYILCGTIIEHGMQDLIIPAFNLVHENNMAKLGPDGEPILRADGKIIKPENFQKVELKTLFPDLK